MGKQTTPILDAPMLSEFAIVAAQNARRLLTDAENLLQRGGAPSAHSLAVLAFEEIGKAWVCVIALLTPPEHKSDLPLANMLRSHLDKLQAARMAAALLALIQTNATAVAAYIQAIEAMEQLARADDLAKQRGFYADCQDGIIWNPAKLPRDEARHMVATVRDLLDNGAPLVQPDFLTFLAKLPDDARTYLDTNLTCLLHALDEDDPEAAVTTMADTLSRLDGLPEMLEQDARRLARERSRHSRTQAPRQSRAQRKGKPNAR